MIKSPNLHIKMCKTADDYDAFTRWKKWLKGLERPGVTRAIKSRYNRRVRREGRKEINHVRFETQS